MEFELRPTTQDEINRHLRSAEFRTGDDTVIAGFDPPDEQAEDVASIRAKIAEGVAQARRGDVRDGSEVFRHLLTGSTTSKTDLR